MLLLIIKSIKKYIFQCHFSHNNKPFHFQKISQVRYLRKKMNNHIYNQIFFQIIKTECSF